MITGFNTDIQYDGVTYHVQTEDKGLDTPVIMSLVYYRGAILASKRSPYTDLLGSRFDEEILAGRLKRQHNLICAAIQAGRIEDLKRMSMKDPSSKREGLVVKREAKKVSKKEVDKPIPRPSASGKGGSVLEPAKSSESANLASDPIETAASKSTAAETPAKNIPQEKVWDIAIVEDVDIIEEEDAFEEEIILPTGTVQIVSDFSMIEEAVSDELKVKFVKDYKFNGGEKKNIDVVVCRGGDDNPVKDANVMVKVIGSAFRPQIFHSKTNSKGVAAVELKLPKFRSGRAAILIRASIDGEETELRRVIKQK
ncbi:MAG: hypothetical protein HKN25_13165 [Pyrinomonadaceae bacterium]|nr:hypothetical protein [Pyrinomonadaceae bacterium]